MSAVANMVRARAWLYDIFAHNHAEQLRIAREVQRKKLGVDQQDYPYPGAVTNSNNPATVIHANTGWAKGAALAAAMLATGAGAAWLMKPSPAVPAVPPPSPTVTAPAPSVPPDAAWDAVTEQQRPDGTWVEVGREHLKTPGGR